MAQSAKGFKKGLFGKCINLYRSGTSENHKNLVPVKFILQAMAIQEPV
jgi:hypothetical protein